MDTLKVFLLFFLVALFRVPAVSGTERVLAVTTAADWTSGGISLLSPDEPFTAEADRAEVCGDAVARWYRGKLYVVNRQGCDAIEVLDPAKGWEVEREFSVGPGTNPQDIAFVSPQRAWVSRYRSNWLLLVNLQTGARVDSVSLAALADSADGFCEMHRMLAHQGRLYVEVQRLDTSGAWWVPVAPSYLAVFDLADGTPVDADPSEPGAQAIRLQGTNPMAPIQVDPDSGELLVPEDGAHGVVDAAGIERVDPVALTSLGFLAGEEELGGDIIDFTPAADSLYYAVVAEGWSATRLVSLNPQSGRPARLITRSDSYTLVDCLGDAGGHLYLADRAYSDPGVRVFDARTGDEITPRPIGTGRPPVELILWEDAGDPLPDPVLAAGQLLPNPSRGLFRIQWSETDPPPREVRVHDAAGRLLRVLPAALSWDGRDREGREVPGGIYLVRIVDTRGKTVTRRAIVLR